MRTGRYLIQTIYSPDNCSDTLEDVKEGCYVKVVGTVKEDDRAYGIEILLKSIKVIAK